MNDATDDHMGQRKYPARAGITALNLIAPGLGLLRLGNWRLAVPFLLTPFGLIALFALGMGHLPITSYGRAVFELVVVLGFSAAIYVMPAVLTWRDSRYRSSVRGWSRWQGLTVVAIVMLSLSQLALPLMHHFYKPFYAQSESMAPTIGKSDKLITDMRWRGSPGRGEIFIFKGPYGLRVSRIAAIPGDRIAMRGGVPILNGQTVVQSAAGRTVFIGYDGLHSAAMLNERLPGEASRHRVLETGPSEFDDMQEVVVPANHLFVLGDNRDSSADSRVPPELGGVGMVPVSAIIGRPLYIYWSSDHSKIGMRLDR